MARLTSWRLIKQKWITCGMIFHSPWCFCQSQPPSYGLKYLHWAQWWPPRSDTEGSGSVQKEMKRLSLLIRSLLVRLQFFAVEASVGLYQIPVLTGKKVSKFWERVLLAICSLQRFKHFQAEFRNVRAGLTLNPHRCLPLVCTDHECTAPSNNYCQ